MTLITPITVDVTVSAPTILVDILTVSGPRGLPGEAGTALVISDDEPPDPVDGMMWLKSDTWVQYTWYVDADGGQWVQTNGGGGGGGGGGGDDLDTTPVAAIGSSIEQTVPEWLAGAPVIEVEDADLFIAADQRGAWVHCMNDIATVIYLPDDWLPGWAFGARQIGTGPVNWIPLGDASMQVPFTKSAHTNILEQYEEVVFRVISNSDGVSAVWSFSGATI